jgi:hypothetical protein
MTLIVILIGVAAIAGAAWWFARAAGARRQRSPTPSLADADSESMLADRDDAQTATERAARDGQSR